MECLSRNTILKSLRNCVFMYLKCYLRVPSQPGDHGKPSFFSSQEIWELNSVKKKICVEEFLILWRNVCCGAKNKEKYPGIFIFHQGKLREFCCPRNLGTVRSGCVGTIRKNCESWWPTHTAVMLWLHLTENKSQITAGYRLYALWAKSVLHIVLEGRHRHCQPIWSVKAYSNSLELLILPATMRCNKNMKSLLGMYLNVWPVSGHWQIDCSLDGGVSSYGNLQGSNTICHAVYLLYIAAVDAYTSGPIAPSRTLRQANV